MRASLGLAALAAALPSCERPPTQLAFRILAEDLVPGWCDGDAYRNDPRCPPSAYRIEQVLVRVCRGGPCRSPESLTCVDGDLFCRPYVDSPRPTVFSLLPGDITVSPADPNAAGRVGISVVATVRVPGVNGDPSSREFIPRRFVVPFVPETTQLVEVWLTSLCIGAVCPPGTTCGRRSCERVDSPPTQPFTPLPAPGPIDGGDRDVSFDVRSPDADSGATDVPADAAAMDAVMDAAAMDAVDAPPADARDDAASDGAMDVGSGGRDGAGDAADASDGRDDRVPGVLDVAAVDVEFEADGAADGCADGACGRIEAVAAGGERACLIHGTSVWCWGSYVEGRVDGAPAIRERPVAITLPFPAQRVAVGRSHACAWSPGRELYCWGDNTFGQLGDGTLISRNAPVPVMNVSAPRGVAVGDDFTCAIDGSDALLCWGRNDARQCGQAASMAIPSAQAVPGVSGARRVAAGGAHACAIDAGGAVYCWGRNASAQLGRARSATPGAPGAVDGLSASDIFLGQNHSCAIGGGAVRCWGETAALRLGSLVAPPFQATPLVVPGVTPMVGAAGVAGDRFSCVLTASREVRCWGAGSFGQLGHAAGSTDAAGPEAGAVAGLTDVVELAAGARHACARTATAVRCWGSNASGQLGRGVSAAPRAAAAPVRFTSAPTRTTAIAAGGGHACAVVDGALWCWGAGQQGQLGNGRLGHTAAPVRVLPPSAATPTAVCAGAAHTCAAYGAELWCWGANQFGMLGDGMAAASSATPVRVAALPSAPVSLACSDAHTCARLGDDSVHCWGANNMGQLGDTLPAGMLSRPTPGPVPGLSATALAAGSGTTCAARADGTVVCWGAAFAGQLGNGLTTIASSATPTVVAGVTGALGVTGGALHHCAWGPAEARCWGTNDEAQLGLRDRRSPRTAMPVTGLTGVTAMSGGYLHTCAIHGGSLSCWGDNSQRACGAASGDLVLAPTPVGLPASPTALAAGGGSTADIEAPATFTCAVVANAPWCWGSNELGELGDGAAHAAAPADVVFMPP